MLARTSLRLRFLGPGIDVSAPVSLHSVTGRQQSWDIRFMQVKEEISPHGQKERRSIGKSAVR